jgi:hypothetical protein
MTERWRFLCFAALGLLLVVGLERLPLRTTSLEDQVQPKNERSSKATPKHINAKPEMTKKARLVPVYDSGSLSSPEPVTQDKENIKVPQPVSKKVKATPPKAQPTPLKNGERPFLEVDYDKIGFEEYLDVVERVGRFFVLVSTEKGNGLGPEISLRNKMMYGTSEPFAEDLASKRPHLVSDPKIQERLSTIDLPKNALRDRVVLIFTKPFDSLLWDEISQSVARSGFEMTAILKVHGSYEKNAKGVFLKLSSAITKKDNKKITLNKNLRVAS